MYGMYLIWLLCISMIYRISATGGTCSSNPTIYTFQVGKVKCTILSDGPTELAVNPFSVPTPAVERSYEKNFRTAFPILLSQNVLVADMPSGRAIFDTGSFLLPEKLPEFPLFENAGQLMKNLDAASISASSIDFVFLTHAHGDHVAGIVTEGGTKAFPNADVFIGRREHEYWSNPNLSSSSPLLTTEALGSFARIYLDAIRPYERTGRFHLVDTENGNGTAVEGIRFISAFGHTDGHCAIEMMSDDNRLVLAGDAWVSTADQLQNPEWGFFTENNRTQAYNSRVKLLSDLARTKTLTVSYHELFPGLGYVQERGAFFEWTALPPQQLGFGVRRKC